MTALAFVALVVYLRRRRSEELELARALQTYVRSHTPSLLGDSTGGDSDEYAWNPGKRARERTHAYILILTSRAYFLFFPTKGASIGSEASMGDRSASSSRQGSNQRGIRTVGKISYDPEQVRTDAFS